MIFHKLIQGDIFTDTRGRLNFFNAFDMTAIVRMYEIVPNDTLIVRGWQAHKNEKKWFYCNAGSFIINLIKVDNFDAPSASIKAERFELSTEKPSILEISGGYATGFKALKKNSKLTVFSNFSLHESKNDDFRFPLDFWTGNFGNEFI